MYKEIKELYNSITNEKLRELIRSLVFSVAALHTSSECEKYSKTLNYSMALKELIDEIQNRKVYVIATGDHDDFGLIGVASTP